MNLISKTKDQLYYYYPAAFFAKKYTNMPFVSKEKRMKSNTGGISVRPFNGLIPKEGIAGDLCTFPYDVLDTEEARKLAEGNKYSFLHVNKPEIDFPKEDMMSLYDDTVYLKAKENIDLFIREGYLERTGKNSLYIYSQTFLGQTQYGLVGLFSTRQYDNDLIKKHENTRTDKEIDRTTLTCVQNANVGPVFLTYRPHESIDKTVNEIVKRVPDISFKATVSVSDNTEVGHDLWIVNDEKEISQLISSFDENVPAAYIADGHHRAASARRYVMTRAIGRELMCISTNTLKRRSHSVSVQSV